MSNSLVRAMEHERDRFSSFSEALFLEPHFKYDCDTLILGIYLRLYFCKFYCLLSNCLSWQIYVLIHICHCLKHIGILFFFFLTQSSNLNICILDIVVEVLVHPFTTLEMTKYMIMNSCL